MARYHRLAFVAGALLAIISGGIGWLTGQLPSVLDFPIFLLVNALVLVTAWRISGLADNDPRWDVRLLDTGIVALALIVGVVLCLGTAGWLGFSNLLLAAGLLAMVAVGAESTVRTIQERIARHRRGEARVRPCTDVVCGLGEDEIRPYIKGVLSILRFVVALAGGLIAFSFAQLLAARGLRPPIGDALGYHLPFAVEWLQSGRFTMPVPVAGDPSTPFYPLNSSIWMFWTITPFESDIAVRFVQAPFLALLVLGAVRLGLEVGPRPVTALIAGALSLTLPDFVRSMSLAENDLMVAALLVVATANIALLWNRPTWWRTLITAATLGLVLGTKVLAVPFVAVLTLAWIAVVIRSWRSVGWKRAGGWLLAGGAAVLLLGGYSYLRNAIVMDNPLYPASVVIGSLELFPGLYTVTGEWKQSHPFYPFDWPALLLGSRQAFGLTITAWVLPGLILAVYRAIRSRHVGAPLLLGMLAVLSLGIFWFVLPYHFQRYLYAVVVWSIVVATWGIAGPLEAILPGRGSAALSIIALPFLAVGAVNIPLEPAVRSSALYWVAALVITGATAVAILAGPRIRARVSRRAVVAGAAAAVLIAIAVWPVYDRIYEQRRFEAWSGQSESVGVQPAAWEWIVRRTSPESATIAVAGTNQIYPLYGDGLDNRVITVQPDGTVASYGWDDPFRPAGEPDQSRWLAALRSSTVDYLYVTPNVDTGGWPRVADWANANPNRFTLAFENEDVRVWAVR